MSHHLLLVAHGSRRESSNDEVRALVDQLRQRQRRQFSQIDCAFLELATPSIPEGLRHAIECSASRITVMPYFLVAGRHVVEDIPAEVDSVRQQFPGVKIEITDYFGAQPAVFDVLLQASTAD